VRRAALSEWIKLRRPRTLLFVCGAFGIMTAGGASPSEPGLSTTLTTAELEQPDGPVRGLQQAAQILGLISLITFGVQFANEYSLRTLRNLLVRRPNRLELLGGKALAVGALVVFGVLVAAACSILITAGLASSEGIATSAWSATEIFAGVAPFGVAMLGYGLLGAALGVMLRSPAFAVGLGAALLPLESIISASWSDGDRWLPGTLLVALAQEGTDAVSFGAAALGAGLWVLAAVAAGTLLFVRREVTE
jgi:ABC-2 type transport system permease protein